MFVLSFLCSLFLSTKCGPSSPLSRSQSPHCRDRFPRARRNVLLSAALLRFSSSSSGSPPLPATHFPDPCQQPASMSDPLPSPLLDVSSAASTAGPQSAPVSPSHPSQVVRRRRAESIDQDADDAFPVRFEWTSPCESVGITGSFNKCVPVLVSIASPLAHLMAVCVSIVAGARRFCSRSRPRSRRMLWA
jgi:hypothetical protein